MWLFCKKWQVCCFSNGKQMRAEVKSRVLKAHSSLLVVWFLASYSMPLLQFPQLKMKKNTHKVVIRIGKIGWTTMSTTNQVTNGSFYFYSYGNQHGILQLHDMPVLILEEQGLGIRVHYLIKIYSSTGDTHLFLPPPQANPSYPAITDRNLGSLWFASLCLLFVRIDI